MQFLTSFLLTFIFVLLAVFTMLAAPLLFHHAVKFSSSVAVLIKTTFHSMKNDLKSNFTVLNSHRSHAQSGFVTLLRPYGGYAQGLTVELPASTEAALIASGGGTTSAGPATAGAMSCAQPQGAVGIAAGQSSVVVTNPLVTPQSFIIAYVSQASADGTLLRVDRIVPAAGSFTIYGNANATAITNIDWAIFGSVGGMSNPA